MTRYRSASAAGVSRVFAHVIALVLVMALPLCAATARAQIPAPPPPSTNLAEASCVIVFGHGRNFEPGQAAHNEQWDQINLAFNEGALLALRQAGWRSSSMVLKVSATDLRRNLQHLVAEAERQACTRVLETTVFADAEAGLLKARLRLYPVQGLTGPRAAAGVAHIGEPLYTSERALDLSVRSLERLRPQALGHAMAEDYLAGRRSGAADGVAASGAAGS